MRLPNLGQLAPPLLALVALGALGMGWMVQPTEWGRRLRRARDGYAGVPTPVTLHGAGLGYAGILLRQDLVQDPLEVITLRERIELPLGAGEPRLMARRLPPYLYAPRAFTAPFGNSSAARLQALAAMAPVRYPPAAAGVAITAAEALAATGGG